MTNDSRRFGFTYGYDDAVTAAMQERTYQWMDIVCLLYTSPSPRD